MNHPIKFAAVGDISLGDFPLNLGFGVRSALEKNKLKLFNKGVVREFQYADVCFGNLETVISDINYNPGNLVSAQMRGGPIGAKFLSNCGLNILSVANNHMMQHGANAFNDTISILNSLDITPIGIANVSGGTYPYMHEVNGNVICFLAYSMRPEKYNTPTLYAQGSKESILADIEQHTKNSDYLILSLHWGDEFIEYPSPEQVATAHEFIDAGAKIIVGHHPHIIQGVEKYKGGIIAYSLGNFVFEFWQKRLKETMILVTTLDNGNVEDIKIVPVRINNSYVPEVLSGNEANALNKKISQLSQHPVIVNSHKCAETANLYKSKYDRNVRWRLIENKIQNRLFFLQNLHRYPKGIVWQSLANFVAGRAGKPSNRKSNF